MARNSEYGDLIQIIFIFVSNLVIDIFFMILYIPPLFSILRTKATLLTFREGISSGRPGWRRGGAVSFFGLLIDIPCVLMLIIVLITWRFKQAIKLFQRRSQKDRVALYHYDWETRGLILGTFLNLCLDLLLLPFIIFTLISPRLLLLIKDMKSTDWDTRRWNVCGYTFNTLIDYLLAPFILLGLCSWRFIWARNFWGLGPSWFAWNTSVRWFLAAQVFQFIFDTICLLFALLPLFTWRFFAIRRYWRQSTLYNWSSIRWQIAWQGPQLIVDLICLTFALPTLITHRLFAIRAHWISTLSIISTDRWIPDKRVKASVEVGFKVPPSNNTENNSENNNDINNRSNIGGPELKQQTFLPSIPEWNLDIQWYKFNSSVRWYAFFQIFQLILDIPGIVGSILCLPTWRCGRIIKVYKSWSSWDHWDVNLRWELFFQGLQLIIDLFCIFISLPSWISPRLVVNLKIIRETSVADGKWDEDRWTLASQTFQLIYDLLCLTLLIPIILTIFRLPPTLKHGLKPSNSWANWAEKGRPTIMDNFINLLGDIIVFIPFCLSFVTWLVFYSLNRLSKVTSYDSWNSRRWWWLSIPFKLIIDLILALPACLLLISHRFGFWKTLLSGCYPAETPRVHTIHVQKTKSTTNIAPEGTTDISDLPAVNLPPFDEQSSTPSKSPSKSLSKSPSKSPYMSPQAHVTSTNDIQPAPVQQPDLNSMPSFRSRPKYRVIYYWASRKATAFAFKELLFDLPFVLIAAIISITLWRLPVLLRQFPNTGSTTSWYRRKWIAIQLLLLLRDIPFIGCALINFIFFWRGIKMVRLLRETSDFYANFWHIAWSQTKEIPLDLISAVLFLVCIILPLSHGRTRRAYSKSESLEAFRWKTIGLFFKAILDIILLPIELLLILTWRRSAVLSSMRAEDDDFFSSKKDVLWQLLGLLLDIPAILVGIFVILTLWRAVPFIVRFKRSLTKSPKKKEVQKEQQPDVPTTTTTTTTTTTIQDQNTKTTTSPPVEAQARRMIAYWQGLLLLRDIPFFFLFAICCIFFWRAIAIILVFKYAKPSKKPKSQRNLLETVLHDISEGKYWKHWWRVVLKQFLSLPGDLINMPLAILGLVTFFTWRNSRIRYLIRATFYATEDQVKEFKEKNRQRKMKAQPKKEEGKEEGNEEEQDHVKVNKEEVDSQQADNNNNNNNNNNDSTPMQLLSISTTPNSQTASTSSSPTHHTSPIQLYDFNPDDETTHGDEWKATNLNHLQELRRIIAAKEEFWESTFISKLSSIPSKELDLNEIIDSEDFQLRETLAHLAATQSKSPELWSILIERGADVTRGNKHAITPLHYAAAYNTIEILEVMLTKTDMDEEPSNSRRKKPIRKPNIYNLKTSFGKSVLDIALDVSHEKYTQLRDLYDSLYKPLVTIPHPSVTELNGISIKSEQQRSTNFFRVSEFQRPTLDLDYDSDSTALYWTSPASKWYNYTRWRFGIEFIHLLADILISPFLILLIIVPWRIPILVAELKRAKRWSTWNNFLRPDIPSFTLHGLIDILLLPFILIPLCSWRGPRILSLYRRARVEGWRSWDSTLRWKCALETFHELIDIIMIPFAIVQLIFPWRFISMCKSLDFSSYSNFTKTRVGIILSSFGRVLLDLILLIPMIITAFSWRHSRHKKEWRSPTALAYWASRVRDVVKMAKIIELGFGYHKSLPSQFAHGSDTNNEGTVEHAIIPVTSDTSSPSTTEELSEPKKPKRKLSNLNPFPPPASEVADCPELYWERRKSVISEFFGFLCDLPFAIIAVFLVLTLWRAIPLYYTLKSNRSIGGKRFAIFAHLLILPFDIICLALWIITLIVPWRAIYIGVKLNRRRKEGQFFEQFKSSVLTEFCEVPADLVALVIFIILSCIPWKAYVMWKNLLQTESQRKRRLTHWVIHAFFPDIHDRWTKYSTELDDRVSKSLKVKDSILDLGQGRFQTVSRSLRLPPYKGMYQRLRRLNTCDHDILHITEQLAREAELYDKAVKERFNLYVSLQSESGLLHTDLPVAKREHIIKPTGKRKKDLRKIYQLSLDIKKMAASIDSNTATLMEYEPVLQGVQCTNCFCCVRPIPPPPPPIQQQQETEANEATDLPSPVFEEPRVRSLNEIRSIVFESIRGNGNFYAVLAAIFCTITLYRLPAFIVRVIRAPKGRKRFEARRQWKEIFKDIFYLIEFCFVLITLLYAVEMLNQVAWAIFNEKSLRSARKVIHSHTRAVFSDIRSFLGIFSIYKIYRLLLGSLLSLFFLVPESVSSTLKPALPNNLFRKTLSLIIYLLYLAFPFVFWWLITDSAETVDQLEIRVETWLILVLGSMSAFVAYSVFVSRRRPEVLYIESMPQGFYLDNKNLLAILGILIEGYQLLALPLTSSLLVFKSADDARQLFFPALLKFSITVDLALFWLLGVGLVIAYSLLGSLPLAVERLTGIGKEGDIEGNVGWRATMKLLSTTLQLTIITRLVRILICDYSSATTLDQVELVGGSGLVCWTGAHSIYATVALLCLIFYLPTSTLYAVNLGVTSKKEDLDLDIKFSYLYQMAAGAAKTFLGIGVVLFHDNFGLRQGIIIAICSFMVLLTLGWQKVFGAPAGSFPLATQWRATMYILAIWVTACTIITRTDDAQEANSLTTIWLIVGGCSIVFIFMLLYTLVRAGRTRRLNQERIAAIPEEERELTPDEMIARIRAWQSELPENVWHNSFKKDLPRWKSQLESMRRPIRLAHALESLERYISWNALSEEFLSKRSTWIEETHKESFTTSLVKAQLDQLSASIVLPVEHPPGTFGFNPDDQDINPKPSAPKSRSKGGVRGVFGNMIAGIGNAVVDSVVESFGLTPSAPTSNPSDKPAKPPSLVPSAPGEDIGATREENNNNNDNNDQPILSAPTLDFNDKNKNN